MKPISIWQPEKQDGEWVFVRPAPLPLGDHYAAPRVIKARKERGHQRICFFGESAAAGYLYAPHLTPAQVLNDQLQTILGQELFEVIDLARTNETLDTLVQTIQQTLQLKPDMLVIFAGNNWNLLETPEVSPYFPSVAGRKRYAAALGEAGVIGPIELAARSRLEKAGLALAQINAVARSVEIPVILVIPEVNLADWETRQPVSWLPGDGTPRWYSLYWQADAALQKREWETAVSLANQMLSLDEGSCPTTFRILALAQTGLGYFDRARAAAEAEVSSNNYATLCFLGAPQATAMDQEIQRRAARHHGFELVDLPAIFARYTGSPLPDRRLFLDYCHLTAEGIKVAMAAVTTAVLRLTGRVDLSWEEAAAQLPDPDVPSAIEATARFGAAIHTAHRLLPVNPANDIIEYWLQAALDADSGIETAMLDLIAARSASCPAVLTTAQQRNIASPFRLLYQHGWRYDYLDVALIEMISRVLARNGRHVPTTINQLLLVNHAVTRTGIEIVYPPFYLWEPTARFFPETMSFADLTERATLRSPWPLTHLGFVTDGTQDINLLVTARLPSIGNEFRLRKGMMRVSVNGRFNTHVKLTHQWANHRLRLPQTVVNPGINRITLYWPPLPPAGTAALTEIITRLQQGVEADIHPIFGELFSVKLTVP